MGTAITSVSSGATAPGGTIDSSFDDPPLLNGRVTDCPARTVSSGPKAPSAFERLSSSTTSQRPVRSASRNTPGWKTGPAGVWRYVPIVDEVFQSLVAVTAR